LRNVWGVDSGPTMGCAAGWEEACLLWCGLRAALPEFSWLANKLTQEQAPTRNVKAILVSRMAGLLAVGRGLEGNLKAKSV
jgi:hypothetical protein